MKRLTVYALVALAVIVVIFNFVAVLFFIAQTVLVTFDRDLGVPHDYPNSEWVSEDGTVTIRVVVEVIEEMETRQAYVNICDGDIEREARVVYRSYGGGGRIMYVRQPQEVFEKLCEIWTVKKFSETEFTVKVTRVEDGIPIFEDDSLVTFYCVDNE